MDILHALRRLLHLPVARARNDAGERIESLRFSVPALRVGVLEYAPGQLQTNNVELDGKTVKLYYPPEAVSDEKFLKSLETAPVVVGGHDSTTNEHNKKIDGWAHTVNFDAAAKAAMIAGVVKGNKEVAYIKSNLGLNDFGASAFVDIFNMEIKSGITDDGQEYNAIAKDLRATHVALAPHVRDPQNKIRVTNAVCINTGGEIKTEGEGKPVETVNIDVAALVKNISMGVKNAVKEAVKNATPNEKKQEWEGLLKSYEKTRRILEMEVRALVEKEKNIKYPPYSLVSDLREKKDELKTIEGRIEAVKEILSKPIK